MAIGMFYFSAFILALMTVFRQFRSRSNDNYKKGFYAFGIAILTSVPAIGFFPVGLPGIVLNNLVLIEVGYALAGLLFVAILFGMLRGRWLWKVHTVELAFEHLPETMDGLKVVQISDVHVGSFFNQYDRVRKAIHKINALNPDYVFFTGDLVNNTAAEMRGWEPVFNEINAKLGKFSILGNHDYGDYVRWSTEEKKQQNLAELIQTHESIGFKPLLNEAIELAQGFWVLGVENWGKAPFRQSGDLEHTLKAVPDEAFKILLSHDPSHFDEQVTKSSNIDLTLSGHTHGMQFGIERFGIRWSPVSLRYKKWAGLYQEGDQYLYVNRGFGYLGFPGRVGIYPEITEIILRKK